MASNKIREAALRALENRYGVVTPDLLMKEARSSKHPLHGDFEWDDRICGLKYRLEQAREIIRSVRYTSQLDERRVTSVKYLHDPRLEPGKQGYVSVTKLRSDRDASMDALMREMQSIQAAIERAQEIAAALDLEHEFQPLFDSVVSLKSRIRKGRSEAEAEMEEGMRAAS